jgi:PST family polysaccharide transporter
MTAATSGLRWFAMSRISTECLLLAAMVVLARMISPAEFGAFATALIVCQLAISVPAEGIGSAIVQRAEATREHLQAGVALTMLVSLAGAGLTLLASYLVVAPLIGREPAALVRLSCPLFLLQGIATVPMAILRRRLDFRRLSIIEIASSAARAIVSLGLAAIAGLGGYALVLGVIAGSAVTAAIAVTGAPAPLPRLRRSAARDLAGYGAPASIAAVAWTGFANGDYAVLAARLGTAAAGMYWRAYTLGVDYQRKASVVMNTLAFPVLARSRDDEDFAALRRRMVGLLTMVLFPMLTGLAITAPIVVPGVFGPAWQQAVVPTQFLCAGGAACLVIDAVGATLMATGRARALLGFGVAHFVVYIGSVVLIAPLGIKAVALDAAVVHSLFVVVAYVMMVARSDELVLSCLWRDLAPAAVGCGAMAAAAVPVDRLTALAGVAHSLQFAAVVAAAGGAYLLTLRAGFEESWADLGALAGRLAPVRKGRRRARALGVADARTAL